MIGSQLGGWGKRANLIPQDVNFNRGNWKAIESRMARCDDLPNNRMFYYVRANYSNSSDLVPSTMNMMLENRSTGSDVWLTFDNVYLGGSNGTSEKNRAVDFLVDQGCL
ncbi:MAG: DNA/RNA non-specific endonuclease, partial [Myxococcota bacterium]